MPAGDRFVEVPADAMFSFLESKGFTRSDPGLRSRREIVYERAHAKDTRFKVLVYTSIAAGCTRARGLGADAIRVCAIFEDPNGHPHSRAGSRGVAKTKRVFRTGTVNGVLERMIERAREAYAVCNQQISRRVS